MTANPGETTFSLLTIGLIKVSVNGAELLTAAQQEGAGFWQMELTKLFNQFDDNHIASEEMALSISRALNEKPLMLKTKDEPFEAIPKGAID